MITALIAPVILGAAGGMVDYHIYRSIATKLQSAADSAALGAANEAILQGWSVKTAQAVAEDYVDTNLSTAGLTKGSYKVEVRVNETDRKVHVDVLQTDFDYLMIGLFKQTPYITASASAQAISDANVCVVGLMKPQVFAKAAVHLDDRARIDSPNCGIYSNSKDRFGFRIDRGAFVRANVICSAGGYFLGGRQDQLIDPAPKMDCPTMDDPLENRPQPNANSGCTYTDMVVTTPETLSPGTYCGGLKVSGDFRVDLRGGEYIIKEGPLIVDGRISFIGDGVGFFLTGEGSTFSFGADTRVELSAPRTGPLAGLLFAEDVNVPHSFNFNPFFLSRLPRDVRLQQISSNDARVLIGTFYLPRSIVLINADAPVADKSAYTAIVAGRLWLQKGPTLVLNADYAATSVPVPDGIGAVDAGVKLIE